MMLQNATERYLIRQILKKIIKNYKPHAKSYFSYVPQVSHIRLKDKD